MDYNGVPEWLAKVERAATVCAHIGYEKTQHWNVWERRGRLSLSCYREGCNSVQVASPEYQLRCTVKLGIRKR